METLNYHSKIVDDYTNLHLISNYTLVTHHIGDGNFSESDDFKGVKIKAYISLTEFLFTGVGLAVMAILGVTGNIVSIIVLTRAPLRSSVTISLLGLTICDTILLITLFLVHGLKALVYDFLSGASTVENFFGFITNNFNIVTDCAQTGSVYFTVAMTLDRYIAVCWPLKSRYLCTWKRANYVAAVVIMVSIAFQVWGHYSIPDESQEKADENFERLNTMCNFSIEDKNSNLAALLLDIAYENYYLRWPYLVFMLVIPYSALLILNSFIYNAIRKANNQRQCMTKKQASEISFAVVCVIIVVIFVISNSSFILMAVVQRCCVCFWNKWKLILQSIDTFLVSVNAASNFLIYCAMGVNFRNQLKKILAKLSCCCRRCLISSSSSPSSSDTPTQNGPCGRVTPTFQSQTSIL